MQKQQLFIEVLKDLRNKIESNNPYQIIKASELIRTLLFDTSGPLVDKINKDFQLKLWFKYKDARKSLEPLNQKGLMPDTFMIADGFYPKTAIANKQYIVSTKRAPFFKALIILHNGKEFTVKDILDHAVNFLGGTHHDDPKKEKQHVLSQLNNELLIGGHNSIVYPIKAIGRVVLDTLSDLENTVLETYSS